MTMTFKEALIAHLQGEKVEVRTEPSYAWMDFGYGVSHVAIREINEFSKSQFEYRIAPRTILVNGVEVPGPEKDAPEVGATYYVPDQSEESLAYDFSWGDDDMDARFLERGLVYLDKESAIARAKAMLITQEVK